MSFKRQLERFEEKQELENLRKIYHKKPVEKCPKCNKKSIFYTNDKKETFCVRCEQRIK